MANAECKSVTGVQKPSPSSGSQGESPLSTEAESTLSFRSTNAAQICPFCVILQTAHTPHYLLCQYNTEWLTYWCLAADMLWQHGDGTRRNMSNVFVLILQQSQQHRPHHVLAVHFYTAHASTPTRETVHTNCSVFSLWIQWILINYLATKDVHCEKYSTNAAQICPFCVILQTAHTPHYLLCQYNTEWLTCLTAKETHVPCMWDHTAPQIRSMILALYKFVCMNVTCELAEMAFPLYPSQLRLVFDLANLRGMWNWVDLVDLLT